MNLYELACVVCRWNRITVVKEEVSQYCVLPSLSKVEQTLTYTVLEHGAKMYRSHLNADVVLSKGDKVVLKQMKQSKWLVYSEHCAMRHK